jgi:hypothetical protein
VKTTQNRFSNFPLSFLLGLLFALSPGIANAETLASPNDHEIQAFAQTATWLKLLHYRKAWFGYQSEVDGAEFYFSPDGRTHPDLELTANLLAFEKSQATATADLPDTRIECRFPARFAVLKKNLKLAANWKMPACPKWEHFRDGIAAKSATLIFSSYYLNNPSSAFGHTFLRLNKESAESGQRHELLDYGIGYAATAGDAGAVMFALGGLFGWFHGDFTNIPYYFKVQEYNDYESRDLWEYDLALTRAEIDLLVAHLWELSNSIIHYQYLTKNCSSLMLTSMEAVAPRLNLMSHLPYWIIPADTVHALYQEPGFVLSYRFRPSKRTQFVYRYDHLTEENREAFRKAIHADDPMPEIAGLQAAGNSAVLDTLIDYYDFRYMKKILRGDAAKISIKQRVLIARSHLPQQTSLLNVPEPTQEIPQSAHGSARSGGGFMWSNKGERSLLLRQRFALHDLLDPQIGYPRDSEIGFLEFNFRVQGLSTEGSPHASAIKLDEFYAFSVKSFAPFESMMPNISWKVRIGAESTWDGSCDDCLAAVAGTGVGMTFALNSSKTLLLTGLMDGDASAANAFTKSSLKLRLGPELNLRAIFSQTLLFQANATYLHLFFEDPLDATRFSQEIRWSPAREWSVGAMATQLPQGEGQYRLLSYWYY